MKKAINKARECKDDIPVAALIVKDGTIISSCINKREEDKDITSHAEILAIREASKKIGDYRLIGCDIFVTLEPCPMCMWAILNSRIENLYFGSYDTKYGAALSQLNLKALANSKINIKGGILEEECDKILKDFFWKMRNEKNT